MTYEEYKTAFMDVAYLAACAVNGSRPDMERVHHMDLNMLLSAAERHLMTGITAMALESAGIHDANFTQAKGKAIRKVAAFDVERAAVFQKLEEAEIWYAPMKGCVLIDLYPRIGMRQMSDNDILCDPSKMLEVKKIMEDLGFESDSYTGCSVHDHYLKQPVLNFEMHRMLFAPAFDNVLYNYYSDVKDRLIHDSSNNYGYHFSDNDFYIYIIAHEYKHYSGSGTGLRSLLDVYVYLKNKEGLLDWSYISEELSKIGLAEFELHNRSLAQNLFNGAALTDEDQEMLEYIISSGVYGTVQNQVKNRIDKFSGKPMGKLRYVISRAILPMDTVRTSFPLFAKIPVLLPFLPVYRLVRGLTVRRGRMKAELKALRNYSDKEKQPL